MGLQSVISGISVSGYVVKKDAEGSYSNWIPIGIGNPQEVQLFRNMENSDEIIIEKGDILVSFLIN